MRVIAGIGSHHDYSLSTVVCLQLRMILRVEMNVYDTNVERVAGGSNQAAVE